MTEEEASAFDSSYQRAKTPLRAINKWATERYLEILKLEEGTETLSSPNYSLLMARRMGQRELLREFQELTRTK